MVLQRYKSAIKPPTFLRDFQSKPLPVIAKKEKPAAFRLLV